jgi:hypothetical protein
LFQTVPANSLENDVNPEGSLREMYSTYLDGNTSWHGWGSHFDPSGSRR